MEIVTCYDNINFKLSSTYRTCDMAIRGNLQTGMCNTDQTVTRLEILIEILIEIETWIIEQVQTEI